MKLISQKECAEIVQENIKQYSGKSKLKLWHYWKIIKPIIQLIVSFLTVSLATETLKHYKYNILLLLGVTEVTMFWKGTIGIICFLFIMILMIIMVVMHELIHAVCYKMFKYHCVFVVSKSLIISTLCISWASKPQHLLAIIFPFFVTQVSIFALYSIFNNVFVFLWITLINLAISCSDILSFIVIMLKVPNDAILFGHYYRRQQ